MRSNRPAHVALENALFAAFIETRASFCASIASSVAATALFSN